MTDRALKPPPGYPPIPSSWRSRKHGTRHLDDYDFGGGIYYYEGRRHYTTRCTIEEWREYAKTAKMFRP